MSDSVVGLRTAPSERTSTAIGTRGEDIVVAWHEIEMDRVVGVGFTAIAASDVGRVYLFDGVSWTRGAAVSTIPANECGITLRNDGGLWTLCSDTPADDTTTPRQLWLTAIEGSDLTREVAPAGWLGPDPVMAVHPDGATAAWVYEATIGERSLGLGVIPNGGGEPSSPCVVQGEGANRFANDPDIACGEGYCAVVWLEASDAVSTDFIVRLAQFPKDDPSHLCP